MGKTVSMSVGRVAIFHDIRKEISANVDHSLTKNNVIFIDKFPKTPVGKVDYPKLLEKIN